MQIYGSAPSIDVNDLRLRLLDTATVQGMSGSPVLQRNVEPVGFAGRVIDVHCRLRLLGVYSGRFATGGPGDAQLGLMWKRSVISDIVRAQRRASF